MVKIKDLAGQRFGRLLTVEQRPQRENRYVVHRCVCVCDCGNEVLASTKNLQRGTARATRRAAPRRIRHRWI